MGVENTDGFFRRLVLFFSFSYVISCPLGNRAGRRCGWMPDVTDWSSVYQYRSNMFPALETELKQEVCTRPSPGTPQKSNTKSEMCSGDIFF